MDSDSARASVESIKDDSECINVSSEPNLTGTCGDSSVREEGGGGEGVTDANSSELVPPEPFSSVGEGEGAVFNSVAEISDVVEGGTSVGVVAVVKGPRVYRVEFGHRKPILQAPSSRKPQRSATFSFSSIATTPKKEQDKRSVSPHRFPLLRSGSVAIRPSSISRPTTPSKSRAVTPTPKRYPSEPRRSASVRVAFEKEAQKEPEQQQQQQPSKSKRLLKALLSRRKTKKDDTLYTYLDEY